jgi:hypothetical protein
MLFLKSCNIFIGVLSLDIACQPQKHRIPETSDSAKRKFPLEIAYKKFYFYPITKLIQSRIPKERR